MEYNSARNHLILPEYGRNIQRMVEHLLTIKDKEKRNQGASAIIDLMGHLNPHLRDIPDFRHKLWDHIFIMSDFKLDVDSPYSKPSVEAIKSKPKRLSYTKNDIKYKVYGKNIENMIKKAITIEEGENKSMVIASIANFMKIAYRQWSKENVNDDIIFENLKVMSKGQLKIPANLKLSDPKFSTSRPERRPMNRGRRK